MGDEKMFFVIWVSHFFAGALTGAGATITAVLMLSSFGQPLSK